MSFIGGPLSDLLAQQSTASSTIIVASDDYRDKETHKEMDRGRVQRDGVLPAEAAVARDARIGMIRCSGAGAVDSSPPSSRRRPVRRDRLCDVDQYGGRE